MPMNEAKRLAEQLRRTFTGAPWYGPSLTELLTDVSAAHAAAHPILGAHGVWEILLHVSAWEGAALKRLAGGAVGLPDEGDWPPIADASDAAWRATIDAALRRHQTLLEGVEGLSDARLSEKLGDVAARETGGGVSVYVTVQGVIQHNVYHLGQIAALKKALKK
jgi:uncharacterized damage-inducible protein DinB